MEWDDEWGSLLGGASAEKGWDKEWLELENDGFLEALHLSQESQKADALRSSSSDSSDDSHDYTVWWVDMLLKHTADLGLQLPKRPSRVNLLSGCTGTSAEAEAFKVRKMFYSTLNIHTVPEFRLLYFRMIWIRISLSSVLAGFSCFESSPFNINISIQYLI